MTAHQRRRAGRDRDWTDAEREGMPATDDQPPGIDADSAVEGEVLPADHATVANERGVTAAEEARPETVRERAARERPDLPQSPPPGPSGRLATGANDPADDVTAGDWVPDAGGLPTEEAAVHVEEG